MYINTYIHIRTDRSEVFADSHRESAIFEIFNSQILKTERPYVCVYMYIYTYMYTYIHIRTDRSVVYAVYRI